MGSGLSRAVDTNVVLRYLTGDDPVQTPIATQLLRSDFMLTASILMETAWVLRSGYRWPRERIATALRELIDLPSAVAAPDGIKWALGKYANGADLPDMIHLLGAAGASTFATFDAGVEKAAGGDAPIPIETLA